jgi:hypothetical protein
VATNLETLIFEIIARDKNASAAFDNLRRKIDGTTGSVDKNTASLNKNQQAQTSAMGGTVGLGIALGAMATPLAAAAAGFTAFAGVAVPSVMKVKTAMTGPGGLAAAWGTLDNRQRNAALGIQALGQQYSALAKAMEPQVFQVFNQGLHLASTLLGPVGQLAASAGKGISSFLAQFTANSGIQQFIGFLAKEAGPAIRLLGQDITGIAHAVFTLLESFGGVGMAELKAFTTVLTGLTSGIAWLATHAPALTNVALAIGGIALALSKFGLLSGALRLTGLATAASEIGMVITATKGLTLAERGLMIQTTALEAITPFGWAILGAAAVGGLVFAISRYKSESDKTIISIEAQSKAQGFNTAGYFQAAAAIQKVNVQQAQQQIALRNVRTGLITGTASLGSLTGATSDYTAAQQKLITEGNNQQTFLSGLQNKYGITRNQAIALAHASGALASDVNKGGQSMRDATAQADAFANANLKAKMPVMGLAAAVAFLTADIQKNVVAVLTLQGDQIAWQLAIQAATKQLASNSAGLKGNSANALANKQAVIAATNAAVSFADDQLKLHGNLRLASQEIQSQINWLEKHGDKTKFATAQIRALLAEEAKIKAQIGTNITVHGSGTWTVHQFQAPGQGKHATAAGWLVRGGVPGVDSVPIMAMPGELVVPTDMVRSGAVDHLRGQIPGFAAGGVVGSFQGSVPGLTSWLATTNAATLHAMEQSVANAVLAGIKAAQSFGGGFPGGPGGGAPAANARLAQLMMPSWATGSAWAAWNYVAMRESGWNQFARNPSSGAYGIPQALPPSKMGAAANPPQSNPVAQIAWMISYIQGRYGSPQAAAAHEAAFNWYDQGGWLPPGLSLAMNGTGRPERVGGGNTYNVTVVCPPNANKAELGRVTVEAIREFEKRSGSGWRS